jgi:serine/threonine protein kinase
VVIKKLGWGHFSTVWMVKDRKAAAANKTEQYFALKVQKSAEHYTEAAMDEVELLDCIAKERKNVEAASSKGGKDEDGVPISTLVKNSRYVATLHDSFFHTGPNGRHMCMVFSMLGCNLLSVIKAYNYRGIPIPVVKKMIKGICKGLDFLHRKCHIIHTDLKPENVLLLFEDSEDVLNKSMAGLSLEDDKTSRNTIRESIFETEKALKNDKLSTEEKKRLEEKLSTLQGKEEKRTFASEDKNGGEMGSGSMLSDWEMSKFLNKTPLPTDTGSLPEVNSGVKRRLSHSAFVTSNFGHRQESADSKLMKVFREQVKVSRASSDEVDAAVKAAENQGGMAEISFVMRAFTPEDELADGVTDCLGKVPWDKTVGEEASREW